MQRFFTLAPMIFWRHLKILFHRLPINFTLKEKIKSRVFQVKWIRKYHEKYLDLSPTGLYGNSWITYFQYVKELLNTSGKCEEYKTYTAKNSDYLDAEKLDIRAIAFYLPQFHPIPENDRWWGKGFTEWTNVTKAVPQFLGHYQPHLPGELGFYDLRLPQVMQQQIALAKQYGIYGFCFHYYWFNGKRVMDKPLNQFLSDETLDIKFCLCWANENWTRRWDGLENEILLAQQHSDEDDIAFIDALIPVFKDKRYIRIDNRPVLIVYRATLLPDTAATAQRWRQRIQKFGISDLYLVAVLSFDVFDPRPLGFDAAVEFPPHHIPVSDISCQLKVINPDFRGNVYKYQEFIENFTKDNVSPFVKFKGIMPSWDNTARRTNAGDMFYGSTPAEYARGFKKICDITISQPPQEHFVFINAWNEWAEGAHLEPDRKFGYGYLQATANVLSGYYHDNVIEDFIRQNNVNFRKLNRVAVVLHCHYEDLIEPIFKNYLIAQQRNIDLFVTVRKHINIKALKEIKGFFHNVYFVTSENRGRDIQPFLLILPMLVDFGYEFSCKLHTKKSVHRSDGEILRQYLFDSLLSGPDKVQQVLQLFIDDPQLGILAPQQQILNLENKKIHEANIFWLDKLFKRVGCSDLIGSYSTFFPAGSMYWFRVQALAGLDTLVPQEECFEDELGQLDGTLAHGLERMIALFAAQHGYQMKAIELFDDYCGKKAS